MKQSKFLKLLIPNHKKESNMLKNSKKFLLELTPCALKTIQTWLFCESLICKWDFKHKLKRFFVSKIVFCLKYMNFTHLANYDLYIKILTVSKIFEWNGLTWIKKSKIYNLLIRQNSIWSLIITISKSVSFA